MRDRVEASGARCRGESWKKAVFEAHSILQKAVFQARQSRAWSRVLCGGIVAFAGLAQGLRNICVVCGEAAETLEPGTR